jgi:hypothetical protein
LRLRKLAARLVGDGSASPDVKKWFKSRAPRRGPLNQAMQIMLQGWSDLARFAASTGRRNVIVHEGGDVTHVEAEESVQLAEQAIGEFRGR